MINRLGFSRAVIQGFMLCVFVFVLGNNVVYASAECMPSKSLSKLVVQIKKDIKDLQGQFEEEKKMNKCTESGPVTFAGDGEKIDRKEYSPDFLRRFIISGKMGMIDTYFSAFPMEFRDALKEYHENLPRLEETKRKMSDHGGEVCFSDEYRTRLNHAYNFHVNAVTNIIPGIMGALKLSSTSEYTTGELVKISNKLSKELGLENKRICKDQETTSEAGLNPLGAASAATLKNQDRIDSAKRARRSEPLPVKESMSSDFTKSFAGTQSGTGDSPPAYFALSTEETPQVDEPKTFMEDPIGWFWGRMRVFENKDKPVKNTDFLKTRVQEQAFRMRHEKWRNERNYTLNRVKDVAGVRTDGFAKKLEYTFTIINEINEQLFETLGYKDTVCNCQKHPTESRCRSN